MLFKPTLNLSVQQGNITALQTDALIVNLFKGVSEPGGATGALDKALDGAVSHLIAGGDIQGDLGEVAVLYPNNAIPARRVIIVGLGEQATFNLEAIRHASGLAIKKAQDLSAANVATIVHGGGIGGLDMVDAAQATAEGAVLALYQYQNPLTEAAASSTPDSLTIVEFDAEKIEAIRQGAKAGRIIAESANLARQWVDSPANLLTPSNLAQDVQTMAEASGLTCQILDEKAMAGLNMNALLSVSKSSAEAARFIILEHKGGDNAPIVLVGKGVTFDTGGYSLKNREGMGGHEGRYGRSSSRTGHYAGCGPT